MNVCINMAASSWFTSSSLKLNAWKKKYNNGEQSNRPLLTIPSGKIVAWN